MSSLPTDLLFWIFIPGLLLVLFFAWLIYLGRGRRATSFSLTALGITFAVSSAPVTTEAKPDGKKTQKG